MNYCCEAYVALYREPCGYHKGRYDEHTCPQIDPSHLRSRYFDLLMEAPGVLKPKADACPFCTAPLTNPGRAVPGFVYADLEDAPDTKGAIRHIAEKPNMEVGAALVGRLFEHARC